MTIVKVDVPLGVTEDGTKEGVAPDGNPETLKVTGELGEMEVNLTVYDVGSPGTTFWDDGEADMVKSLNEVVPLTWLESENRFCRLTTRMVK